MKTNFKKIILITLLCLMASGCARLLPLKKEPEKRADNLCKDVVVRQDSFEFKIVERWYSRTDSNGITIGIANIHNYAPQNESQVRQGQSIEKNKQQILFAVDEFKKRGVNMIIFPEFCLTGYFWDVSRKVLPVQSPGLPGCWQYMNKGSVDKHLDWIIQLKSRLGNGLEYIIFNSIRRQDPSKPAGPENKFLNSTYVIDRSFNCKNLYATSNEKNNIYDKTFLPGIEKTYESSGIDDFLILDTKKWGRFGFTTCYDMCFSQLYEEYAMGDKVDAIIQVASWRGTGNGKYGKDYYKDMRDYSCKPITTNYAYGYQWDVMAASRSATNQVWLFASNAFGNQKMILKQPEGKNLNVFYEFWGGSGLWAPSGMNLVKMSSNNGKLQVHENELLIVHNIDILGEVKTAKDNFGDYNKDFRYYSDSPEPGIVEIYKPVKSLRTFTRQR